MVKGSQQYAILAVYQLTDKGCQLLQEKGPVMLSETKPHHNTSSTQVAPTQGITANSSTSSTNSTTLRKERGG